MTANRIVNVLKQTVLRLGLVLAFLLSFMSLFLRAQAPAYTVRAQENGRESEVIRVFYHYNSPKIDDGYMSNPEAMARIATLVNSGVLDNASLEIVSYSSPEGDYKYNTRLSARRANALQSYLLGKYPVLDGKVSTNPGTESWVKLRADVIADSRLSDDVRNTIINIIDSNAKPDEKEYALKALAQYRELYANYFSALRYAEIRVKGIDFSARTSTGVSGNETEEGTSTSAVSTEDGPKGGAKVYFMVNDTEIKPAYMDNESNLLQLRSILSNPAAEVSSIVIVGTASPEGPEGHNEELAAARAQALVDYITENCPAAAGKITVQVKGEDWDGLRAAVVAEPSLTDAQKEEVLAIIDSDETPARKEALLKKTSSWRTIRRKILPVLRYSAIGNIEFVETAQPADTTQKDTTQHHHGDSTQKDTTTTLPQVDTTQTQPQVDTTKKDTTGTVIVPPIVGGDNSSSKIRPMVMALKTNLLYDAVTALNFEVEVPIGKNFSIMAEDVFPWWETGNKYCFQMWEVGIEPRYWFTGWDVMSADKLQGFFVGPYVMSSKFDFQYDTKLNYQGEYWSTGISAGYAKPISDYFNLEFSLSVGYVHTDFRHYLPADDYSKLIRDPYNVGSVSYFGPTKAKVSLVMPLPFNRHNKEVKR